MIPGVETLHRRDTFLTRWASGSPVQLPFDIWQPVAHDPGTDEVPDGDLGEFDYHVPRWLDNVQQFYLRERGYNVGYLWAIDWLGGVWELRGFDYRSAANSGANHYTAPVLFIVDRGEGASDLALASARAVWREHRRRSGRDDFANRPLGHGELPETTSGTSCPNGVLSQLHAGHLDLDYQPPPEEAAMFDTFEIRNVRAYDSRTSGDGPLAAGEERTIDTGEDGAHLVVVNVVAVDPQGDGYLAAWRPDRPWPGTSILNYAAGQTIANTAFVETDLTGSIRIRTLASTHVVVDVQAVSRAT